MNFSDRFLAVVKRLLPSPFTIAVLLSLFTYLLAFFLTKGEKSTLDYGIELLSFWESGLWTNGLLVFAVQMMLMLVLGHVLAITPLVDRFISSVSQYATDTSKSALLVSFFTMLVAYFNWGLGLVFGAVFARKVGENALRFNRNINYPLVGAAGYSGLLVWHGGISGSATTKVAEGGHLQQLMSGLLSDTELAQLPTKIGFEQTVFSMLNGFVFVSTLLLIPLVLYVIGKKVSNTKIDLNFLQEKSQAIEVKGAEKLDHSRILSLLFGAVVLGVAALKMTVLNNGKFLNFFTPNNINILLFGLCILLHPNFNSFSKALDNAISGVSGILIQFPLYFGIMGIMNKSGLVASFSTYIASVASETTFPIFTFISAAIVNVFVPSGGGQWAIQGPIIIKACLQLDVALPKAIMAMCYGDQLTNMLQPFWALPLLGITQLKVKDMLPFTLVLFLLGATIFLLALLLY